MLLTNSYEARSKLDWRDKHLKVMGVALRMYGQTKDKKFLEFAKYFGGRSKEFQKEYDTL